MVGSGRTADGQKWGKYVLLLLGPLIEDLHFSLLWCHKGSWYLAESDLSVTSNLWELLSPPQQVQCWRFCLNCSGFKQQCNDAVSWRTWFCCCYYLVRMGVEVCGVNWLCETLPSLKKTNCQQWLWFLKPPSWYHLISSMPSGLFHPVWRDTTSCFILCSPDEGQSGRNKRRILPLMREEFK